MERNWDLSSTRQTASQVFLLGVIMNLLKNMPKLKFGIFLNLASLRLRKRINEYQMNTTHNKYKANIFQTVEKKSTLKFLAGRWMRYRIVGGNPD